MPASEGKYGDIHRYEPASESAAAAVAIVLLTVFEVIFVALFTVGLLNGWATTGPGNMFLGGVFSAIFIVLALILVLYRREFLPDVMIVKKRRRKWEDVSVREEDIDGETLTDGAFGAFKRAIYPYYKR